MLTSIADLYCLQQLISDPTRISESSSTLIDLIYTNSPDRVVCSGVSHVSISDHSMVYAYRKISIGLVDKGHRTVTYRRFKDFDNINTFDVVRFCRFCGILAEIFLEVLGASYYFDFRV